MIRLVTRILFCCFSVLVILFHEESHACQKSPRDVVEHYYVSDLNGVRIGQKLDADFGNLYVWKYEPGWDYAFVVNEVNIYQEREISNAIIGIDVKYHVVGILGGDYFYSYEFDELIEFVLLMDENVWKIKEPISPPHISPASAINQLEKIIRTEGKENAARANKLLNIVEKLKEIQK